MVQLSLLQSGASNRTTRVTARPILGLTFCVRTASPTLCGASTTRTRRHGLLFIKVLPAMAVGLRASLLIQATSPKHISCARLAVVPAQPHLHLVQHQVLPPRLALLVEDVLAIAHGLAPALATPTMAVAALLVAALRTARGTRRLGI